MGTIITGPNPAFAQAFDRPQESPVSQIGQILALKQQQAEAPLRMQALQQQVQGGQLDLQQKQIQAKDAQAMSKVMQEWAQPPTQSTTGATAQTSPDYDRLLTLARQGGVSFGTYQGLQQHILEMKDKASSIVKNDAQAGSANATAMSTKNKMLIDAMSGVQSLPDDQLVPGLLAATQDLAQKQLLDPQHVQMAQQLAQTGDPAKIRQALNVQITGMGGFNKMLEDAQKKAQAQQEQGKSDPNSPFYAPSAQSVAMGTAPGAAQIQAGEVKQAAAKAGAEAKARFPYNPTLVMQGMSGGVANNPNYQGQGGGTDWAKVAGRYGLSSAAFDQQAEKYFQTGQLPPIGRGSANVIAQNRDLMNRAAELHPNASLALGSAEYKANVKSLEAIQKSFDTVNAFEQTADKNIDMLKGFAAKVPDMGSRFANVPVRMISGNMIGSENMAAFRTALAPVQAESAKILNSANLSGQLSDSARHELQDIVDGNAPYKSLVASLNVLQQDFKNRHDSYINQITDIQNRIKGADSGNSQPTSQPSTSTPPASSGDPFSQFGGKAH